MFSSTLYNYTAAPGHRTCAIASLAHKWRTQQGALLMPDTKQSGALPQAVEADASLGIFEPGSGSLLAGFANEAIIHQADVGVAACLACLGDV